MMKMTTTIEKQGSGVKQEQGSGVRGQVVGRASPPAACGGTGWKACATKN